MTVLMLVLGYLLDKDVACCVLNEYLSFVVVVFFIKFSLS